MCPSKKKGMDVQAFYFEWVKMRGFKGLRGGNLMYYLKF